MKKMTITLLFAVGVVVVGAQALAKPTAPAPAPSPPPVSPTAVPRTPAPIGSGTSAPPKLVRFAAGTNTWSDISGYGGSGVMRAAGNGDSTNVTTAISGIEMVEHWDNPDKAIGTVKVLNSAAVQPFDEGFVALTGGATATNFSDKVIQFAQRKFVRGGAVCTGDENDTTKRKIKGLKLFFATVSPEGVVTTEDTSGTSWERTNCKVWHPTRFCASNKVARTMRFLADKDNKWFQGIQLECMTPELN